MGQSGPSQEEEESLLYSPLLPTSDPDSTNTLVEKEEAQNETKILRMTLTPQIAEMNQETIRIEIPIPDQQTQRKEVQKAKSLEESGSDGFLSSESGSSSVLADDESFDWTIKARIPPWPTLQISNRALQGFLHKKLTTLFLNQNFFEEVQQYSECIGEEREWQYNAKTKKVWDLLTWEVPY
ncbi:uncharacterized protein BT62DRAFT_918290 [Guyanagaster necrorhizus]|uniref:Uncharacterized protein n=1 Tax=Guyanagaster necrorhizus TaxID=856835 RepID=A0A9P8AUR4_9AGAR|nr:uncharacterized protein BT62DRAFT_918290 [Guyanagaster necrorhizus MCA 3950]KAG7448743.1 hypothetical protein BT62DRAFT_918290 [Guyanagaster necrorhizus MCA 3950]